MLFAPPQIKKIVQDGMLVACQFGRDAVMPDGQYLVRGGIQWPSMGEENGIEAFALVCAKNIKTDITYVVMEHPYVVIDWILRPDGGVRQDFPALAPFLMDAWSQWLCRTFFWNQTVLEAQPSVQDVRRSQNINPQPILRQVAWDQGETPVGRLHQLGASGRLFFEGGGEVHQAMKMRDADPTLTPPPLQALYCAIVGLENLSHRVRQEVAV